MDREGKDTWRHRKAGAQTIGIASPTMLGTIRETEADMSVEQIAGRYFWSEDILLTEGYKRAHFPKIEIFRSAISAEPLCGIQDNLLAIVTEDEVKLDIPLFRFDEVPRVADLIEERYLKGRKKPRIVVTVDGKQLPMNDFVKDFVIGGTLGMLSSLRGWKTPRKIELQIRLEDD
jgi:molybdopterin-guanine dinucleotide biosynthesis protein B